MKARTAEVPYNNPIPPEVREAVWALVADINRMATSFEVLSPERRVAIGTELGKAVDRLLGLTTSIYDAVATDYQRLRGERPSSEDAAIMDEVIDMARSRAERSGSLHSKIRVLDVGSAYGRDLAYLARFPDVEPLGIDNSPAFVQMLATQAQEGKIPQGSFLRMDMRHMPDFTDGTFDVVRHNATLLHIPILPNGAGADEAVRESFRVLKPGGLLYVSVKAGRGFKLETAHDTSLGRPHQYYTRGLLTDLLNRNGFRILRVLTRRDVRRGLAVRWLIAFAEKPVVPLGISGRYEGALRAEGVAAGNEGCRQVGSGMPNRVTQSCPSRSDNDPVA